METVWTVEFSKKALKQSRKLAKREQELLQTLLRDLRRLGPFQKEWPNYSKLGGNRYHCHLSYSWVACWTLEEDDDVNLIEIYYVGSRENAPY
jgi:hypothetical protein